MVHEIAVNCGNGTKSVGLGLPKADHGKNHCPWFGEEACVCTKIGANRVMGFPLGRYWHSFWALEAVRTGCVPT